MPQISEQEKLFAAIHLGNLIIGTPFEGGQFQTSINFLANLLTKFREGLPSSIRLPEASTFTTLAEDLRQADALNQQITAFIRLEATRATRALSDLAQKHRDSVCYLVYDPAIESQRQEAKKKCDLASEKRIQAFCQDQARALSQSILGLKTGERLLIPAGVGSQIGQAGHAILCMIEKKSDDQYMVRLFNTGDGLSNNHATALEPTLNQLFAAQTLSIGPISQREMKNEAVLLGLEALIIAQTVPSICDKQAYTMDQIYDLFRLMFLNHPETKAKVQPVKESDLHKAQKSGNCFYYAFKPWLRLMLEQSPFAYAFFHYYIKSKSLDDFYQQKIDCFDEQSLFLLKAAIQGTASTLLKLREKTLSSEPELSTFFESELKKLEDKLDILEVKENTLRTAPSQATYLHLEPMEFIESIKISEKFQLSVLPQASSSTLEPIFSEAFNFITKETSVSSIADALGEALKTCQAPERTLYRLKILAALDDYIITSMPDPVLGLDQEHAYFRMKIEEQKKLLKDMRTIHCHMHHLLCQTASFENYEDQIIAICTLRTLMDMLTRKILQQENPKITLNEPLTIINPILENPRDFFLQSTSLNHRKKWIQLKQYYLDDSGNKRNENFFAFVTGEKNLSTLKEGPEAHPFHQLIDAKKREVLIDNELKSQTIVSRSELEILYSIILPNALLPEEVQWLRDATSRELSLCFKQEDPKERFETDLTLINAIVIKMTKHGGSFGAPEELLVRWNLCSKEDRFSIKNKPEDSETPTHWPTQKRVQAIQSFHLQKHAHAQVLLKAYQDPLSEEAIACRRIGSTLESCSPHAMQALLNTTNIPNQENPAEGLIFAIRQNFDLRKKIPSEYIQQILFNLYLDIGDIRKKSPLTLIHLNNLLVEMILESLSNQKNEDLERSFSLYTLCKKLTDVFHLLDDKYPTYGYDIQSIDDWSYLNNLASSRNVSESLKRRIQHEKIAHILKEATPSEDQLFELFSCLWDFSEESLTINTQFMNLLTRIDHQSSQSPFSNNVLFKKQCLIFLNKQFKLDPLLEEVTLLFLFPVIKAQKENHTLFEINFFTKECRYRDYQLCYLKIDSDLQSLFPEKTVFKKQNGAFHFHDETTNLYFKLYLKSHSARDYKTTIEKNKKLYQLLDFLEINTLLFSENYSNMARDYLVFYSKDFYFFDKNNLLLYDKKNKKMLSFQEYNAAQETILMREGDTEVLSDIFRFYVKSYDFNVSRSDEKIFILHKKLEDKEGNQIAFYLTSDGRLKSKNWPGFYVVQRNESSPQWVDGLSTLDGMLIQNEQGHQKIILPMFLELTRKDSDESMIYNFWFQQKSDGLSAQKSKIFTENRLAAYSVKEHKLESDTEEEQLLLVYFQLSKLSFKESLDNMKVLLKKTSLNTENLFYFMDFFSGKNPDILKQKNPNTLALSLLSLHFFTRIESPLFSSESCHHSYYQYLLNMADSFNTALPLIHALEPEVKTLFIEYAPQCLYFLTKEIDRLTSILPKDLDSEKESFVHAREEMISLEQKYLTLFESYKEPEKHRTLIGSLQNLRKDIFIFEEYETKSGGLPEKISNDVFSFPQKYEMAKNARENPVIRCELEAFIFTTAINFLYGGYSTKVKKEANMLLKILYLTLHADPAAILPDIKNLKDLFNYWKLELKNTIPLKVSPIQEKPVEIRHSYQITPSKNWASAALIQAGAKTTRVQIPAQERKKIKTCIENRGQPFLVESLEFLTTLKALRKKDHEIYRQITSHSLDYFSEQFLPMIQEFINENNLTIENLEKQLLFFINAPPNDPALEQEYQLLQLAGRLKPLSMEDAFDLYLSESELLFRKLTYLNIEQQDDFRLLMTYYLMQMSEKQQWHRTQELVIHQTQEEDSEQNILDALRQRVYSIDPSLQSTRIKLVIECKSNILLRETQNEKIDKLEAEEPDTGKRSDLLCQLLMGEGKSKVISPILVRSRANGQHVPFLIVPQELFEQSKADISDKNSTLFGQRARTFGFRREIITTQAMELCYQGKLIAFNSKAKTIPEKIIELKVQFLDELYKKLLNAQKEQGYFIVTSSTLHNLCLARVEALERGETDIVACFNKIKIFIKEHGEAIIDEVDLVLDPRKETHLTLADPALADETELLFCSELYQLLGPEKAIDEVLIRSVASKLLGLNADQSNQFYASVCSLQRKDEKPLGLQFLSQDEYDKKPKKSALIALARYQLGTLLSLTLEKQLHVHYGFDPSAQRLFSIPYHGNNKPVEYADIGNVYECINYTIQMYTSFEIPDTVLREILVLEKKLFERERNNEKTIHQSQDIFKKLFDENLASLDPTNTDQINNFKDKLKEKNNIVGIHYLLQKHVLSTLKIYPKKISHYNSNLVELFDTVQGFTGSPWNASSFHPKFSHDFDQTIDTQVTESIIQKQKDPLVFRSDGFETSALLKSCTDDSFSKRLHAFIDVGSIFSGQDNLKVVSYFKDSLKPNAPDTLVIFFDSSTNCLKLLENSEVKCFSESVDPARCFTYYDQPHTTGTDIKQAKDATALISANINTNLRDILQGAFRMRQLFSGQDVRFILPAPIYDQFLKIQGGSEPLKSSDIIKIAAQTQVLQVFQLNMKGFEQNIGNIFVQACEALLAGKEPGEQVKLYHLALYSWYKTIECTDAYHLFSQTPNLQNASIVYKTWIDGLIQKFRSNLEAAVSEKLFVQETADSLLQDVQNKTQRLLSFAIADTIFPEKIPEKMGPEASMQSEVQRMQQKEQEQMQEQEQEQTQEQERLNADPAYLIPLSLKTSLTFNIYNDTIETIFKALNAENIVCLMPDPDCSKMKDLNLSENLLFSENFFRASNGEKSSFHNPTRKLTHHLIILRDLKESPYRAILVDDAGFQSMVHHFQNDEHHDSVREIYHVGIDGKFYHLGKTPQSQEPPIHNSDILHLVMQAQVFCADEQLLYDPMRFQFLAWMAVHPNPKRVHAFIAYRLENEDFKRNSYKSFVRKYFQNDASKTALKLENNDFIQGFLFFIEHNNMQSLAQWFCNPAYKNNFSDLNLGTLPIQTITERLLALEEQQLLHLIHEMKGYGVGFLSIHKPALHETIREELQIKGIHLDAWQEENATSTLLRVGAPTVAPANPMPELEEIVIPTVLTEAIDPTTLLRSVDDSSTISPLQKMIREKTQAIYFQLARNPISYEYRQSNFDYYFSLLLNIFDECSSRSDLHEIVSHILTHPTQESCREKVAYQVIYCLSIFCGGKNHSYWEYLRCMSLDDSKYPGFRNILHVFELDTIFDSLRSIENDENFKNKYEQYIGFKKAMKPSLQACLKEKTDTLYGQSDLKKYTIRYERILKALKPVQTIKKKMAATGVPSPIIFSAEAKMKPSEKMSSGNPNDSDTQPKPGP